MKFLFYTVIPDNMLEEYLKDKLLVKPDYGYSTEKVTEPTSNWIERDKIRTANNTSAKRRLKR